MARIKTKLDVKSLIFIATENNNIIIDSIDEIRCIARIDKSINEDFVLCKAEYLSSGGLLFGQGTVNLYCQYWRKFAVFTNYGYAEKFIRERTKFKKTNSME